jgi:ABC-type glycerol-3-phosphate transport system permease component
MMTREQAAPASAVASRRRVGAGQVAQYGVLSALLLLALYPIFLMVSMSLRPAPLIYVSLFALPSPPILDNYRTALFDLIPALLRTLFVVAVSIAGTLALAAPAAYAFARMRFRGREAIFALVLGTMIVPGVVTIVPTYVLIARLDWVNTPQGVIVPSIAHTGFYVFLLRQYFLTLPQEIFDAARVDGAGPWASLWRIGVPNVRPAIVVVLVMAFLSAWNQYLWPLIVLNDMPRKTLAVGMQFFARNSESAQLWGPMMATATLATLPPLILYALAQRRIISTFVTSGLKG